jgi:hypothetical protein
MKTLGESQTIPLFSYSANLMLVAAFLPQVLLVPAIVTVILVSGVPAGLLIIAADAFYLGTPLRLYIDRVLQARFYEDHFEVKGRKLNDRIDYDEITGVDRLISLPVFTNRTRVKISVASKGTIVIPANLRNKKLNVDLASWLSSRMRR